MLDVLIGILKFLVENLWVSLGLGVSIFISLMILENNRVKHYGEPFAFCTYMVGKWVEDVWKTGRKVTYSDHSCSRYAFPRDATSLSYRVNFGGSNWTSQNVGHIYKIFKMDYRNKGVVEFDRKRTEEFDPVCLERISS